MAGAVACAVMRRVLGSTMRRPRTVRRVRAGGRRAMSRKAASWVTERSVTPSSTRSRSSGTSSIHVRRSCPNVGSSRITTRGRATSTRGDRESPLLAARQRERVRPGEPIEPEPGEHLVGARVDLRRGQAERARRDREFAAHGRGDELVLGLLEDRADAGQQFPRAPPDGGRLRGSRRARRMPRTRPASGAASPPRVSARVDLPAPFGPVSTVERPSGRATSSPARTTAPRRRPMASCSPTRIGSNGLRWRGVRGRARAEAAHPAPRRPPRAARRGGVRARRPAHRRR